MNFSLNPVGGFVVVALVALCLLALLAVGPRQDRATKRRRRMLGMLRLLVVLLLILAFLRPTFVYTQTRQKPATLVILLDQSISMTVPDGAGKIPRWEELKTAVAEARPDLADLPESLEVLVYTFDGEAYRVDIADGSVELPEEPEGRQTAIGAVLSDVLRLQSGKRIAGVVLLSDGAQRAHPSRNVLPDEAVARLRGLGAPLYTVTFGQPIGLGQVRDVALDNLQHNGPVFEKNPLVFRVEARVAGFVNQPIPVRLLVENAEGELVQPEGSAEDVTQAMLEASEDGELLPVELSFTPPDAGEYKIQIEADAQPGELVVTNNVVGTFVTVMKGGLKVLYLTGARRMEQKFLRMSLDSSPDINVEFVRFDAEAEETRPKDLLERLRPEQYDVYIIGDLDSRGFTPEQLETLAETVRRGAGLIMLGGFHSFGPGLYQTTPLADVLPISMDRTERQDFGGEIIEDLHLKGPLTMLPTSAGLRYVMRIAPGDKNEAVWRELPPLEGANKFAGLKADAVPFAETPDDDPLLVAHTAGRGRVLAFAGDSTWRWWMQGYIPQHKRFWRQIVLFLAKKDQDQDQNVWIDLDKRRFRPGARIDFTTGARTPTGDPIPDADFNVEIRRVTDAEGKPLSDPEEFSPRLARQGDVMAGTFLEGEQPGDYEIQVTASRGDELIGQSRARFLVFEQDLERDKPAAQPSVMRSLAEQTSDFGGRAVVPEQLPGLLEEIKNEQVELEVQEETHLELWDTWPFFLALVGLLALEWFLRKRWRLV